VPRVPEAGDRMREEPPGYDYLPSAGGASRRRHAHDRGSRTPRGEDPACGHRLLGLTSRAMVAAIQAVWLASGCVTIPPLSTPTASIDEFPAQTRTCLRHDEARLVLPDPSLAALYQP